jgi:hypothetical protein
LRCLARLGRVSDFWSSWILLDMNGRSQPSGIGEQAGSLHPRGGQGVLSGRNGYLSCGLPPAAEDGLTELHDEGSEIRQVAFAPDGNWVILFDSNGYWHSELP